MTTQIKSELDDTASLPTQTASEVGGVHKVVRLFPVEGQRSNRYPAYLQVFGTYAGELLSGLSDTPSGGNIFRVIGTITQQSEEASVSFADMVAQIKIAFSLSVSDLAQILHVERPTIYAWLDERWVPKEENVSRVTQVFRHANYWSKLNRKALSDKQLSTKVSGHCLHEALRAKKIHDARVTALLDYWATQLPVRVTDLPKDSIRAAAIRHGIDLSKHSEQQDVIDRITGKRISDDR